MPRQHEYVTSHYPKTLLLGVHAPYNQIKNVDTYFEEFLNLCKTNKIQNYETLFIKIRDIDPAYFLTKGKLEEVKEYCDKHNIEQVVISEMISPMQERNLGDFLDCSVFDRTQLILEIFEKAAHSAEGKAQVEIAMLQYQKTRLAGKGLHLSQQAGIRGLRGGYGETAKEKERRHIESQMLKLKKQLEQLQKNKDTQRKKRISSGIPHICLIGYTNAGKSTVLNALTKSNVLAEDKLFATLDTTTRELYIDSHKIGLLSDTVGFIQHLAPHLIEAFKSTLSELQHADLLMHVVDISDENWEDHIRTVHEILEQLDVQKEMIYVFNKVDKITNLDSLSGVLHKYQPQVFISAINKESIKPLKEFLAEWNKNHTPTPEAPSIDAQH